MAHELKESNESTGIRVNLFNSFNSCAIFWFKFYLKTQQKTSPWLEL